MSEIRHLHNNNMSASVVNTVEDFAFRNFKIFPNPSVIPPNSLAGGTFNINFRCCLLTHTFFIFFSQPSIYIDGWLYGMRMTSVVCNVPVLSQNDSTYHHSICLHDMKVTSLRYLDAKFHHPSLGASPLIKAKPYLPASRTLVIIKTAKRK